MENSYRLKIKVGSDEFEAEGPREDVQAQFEAWKELISTMPPAHAPYPQIKSNGAEAKPPVDDPPNTPDQMLNKITKVDGRIVSLTVRPETVDDSVLLILYGQKVLRENESVTGSEVLDGITSTGGMGVDRVDRLLEKMAALGNVIVTGQHRSKRYRLTNKGLQEARSIASKCLDIVA